jgi:hypothetical protein
VFGRNEVLALHDNSNIEVTRAVIQCLLPGAWLNDEVRVKPLMSGSVELAISGLHWSHLVAQYLCLIQVHEMVVAVRSLFLGVVTGNDLRGQNKIVDLVFVRAKLETATAKMWPCASSSPGGFGFAAFSHHRQVFWIPPSYTLPTCVKRF